MLSHEYIKLNEIIEDYLFKKSLGIKDYNTDTSIGRINITGEIVHFANGYSISFQHARKKYVEALRFIEGP